MALALLFWMALMVASQAVSWTLLIKSSSSSTSTLFYQRVCQLSLFYMAWALYKKIFLGDEHELGHFSFGFLALATYFRRKWWSIAANLVLLVNFGLAVIIIFSYDPASLAEMIKHDDSSLGVVWAFTFDAYILSSVALWSFCLHKLFQFPAPIDAAPSSSYTSLPTATTTNIGTRN